jgi:hypothetical protein
MQMSTYFFYETDYTGDYSGDYDSIYDEDIVFVEEDDTAEEEESETEELSDVGLDFPGFDGECGVA